VIGLILIGQNHLYVKMLFYKRLCYSEVFHKILQSENSGSLSAVRTTVPSRPDAHLSTVSSVRTTCHTVRTLDRPSIIRLDDVDFHPDGHPPWSGRAKALYGNYLQRTCGRLDDSVSPSRRDSQTGKIFSENLENSSRTVVRPEGPCPPSGWRPNILQQSPI
jgi:hypothetical protein